MTQQPRVVGLGMAVLDLLIRLKEMPTWERGAHLRAVAIEGRGPVATAIVAVARLGVSAGFIGTAGNDRMAKIKMETLTENGVDVSHVIRRDAPENQVVLVSVEQDTGERVFSGLGAFRSNPLLPSDLDKDYIIGADYLHLDGSHHEAAMQAAKWMHEVGKPVMLDGSKTDGPVTGPMAELVRQVDVLICGSGFAAGLTGIEDVWERGKAVLSLGPQIVVQPEGADGSYTVTKDEQFHTPAFRDVPIIDTTGAGDVFHGAYIVAQLQGWDLRRCAYFATAVSAIKCTKLSGRAGIPTFQGTLDFLRQHGIEM